ncbi:MAG: CCA tRNA nucleotidyltransferase [Candidatus Omnitrophica bacterium]|nr:CCA tRNA nucleotidyltransferase [Candidatus Omnitrophota bacterium]
MREYLRKLPRETQDLIGLAGEIASVNNMRAYLVGGFARDLILGVKNLDLDIVVEGDGIKFAEDFARATKAALTRHKRFGTATARLAHNLKIDIATARQETYPFPASLPQVRRGTLRDDLARRDFTINAMAISIGGRDFGRLIDFFSGKKDLADKKIRVLHELSFIDDPTRILRAVRFEKRYNFRIEPQTLLFLKGAVRLKMLEKVQPQRLRDEIILILKEGRPLKELRRIRELAGYGFISPRLAVSKSTDQLLTSIGNCIGWFEGAYPRRRQLDSWLIYFMGLLDSLSLSDTRAVCRKFVFSRGEEKRLLSSKGLERKFAASLGKAKVKPSVIFNLLEPLSYETIILFKAKYKNRHIQKYIEDFFDIYNGMRIEIRGDDLHKLGVMPGPRYKKIFTGVLQAKLDGLVKTKAEELVLIKKLIERKL